MNTLKVLVTSSRRTNLNKKIEEVVCKVYEMATRASERGTYEEFTVRLNTLKWAIKELEEEKIGREMPSDEN